jgi:hypothetical protein
LKLNIPFEKTIKFDTDIYEICSISLEHEITKNETDLLGNFIFEGTYKENSLSINETPFNFIVPFTVDFTNPVDTDSINFVIDDFTYEIKDNNLVVHINYLVECEEKNTIEPVNETRDNVVEIIPEREETIDNNVINSVMFDDDYITYHVHVIKDDETIETISQKYNCDVNSILKLNQNIEVTKGNKLIIPICNE